MKQRSDPNEPPKGMSPEEAEAWRKAPVAERLHAFREYVLQRMRLLGDTPTKKAIRSCSYLWIQFRKAAEKQGAVRRKGGEARKYIESCYTDPRYLHFRKHFVAYYKATATYKASQAQYAREHYEQSKAYRAQPEVRERINERRRKSYNPAKRHEKYLAKRALTKA